MGLIKSMVGSVGGTLHDQWQDLIQCEDMGNTLLMKKITTPTGQISKGSRILVAPGQMAVILDSGAIVDATAESGVYEFDQSSSPSFFGGQFGAVFKEMWQRFKYNGTPAKGQSVYYFNTTEILDNKFGTATPIIFQDWSHPIPNQMTGTYSPMRVEVRCYGTYTFSVGDPVIFMENVAGAGEEYRVDQITDQMRAEVIGSFQNVLNELGTAAHKVPVMELPSRTDEIKKTMDEKVFDAPIRERGLQLRGFVVESVSLDEESSKKIDNYELSSNSMMQQGTLVGAYANAVQDAANNANGAGQGFMGLGMMNMTTGGMIGGVSNAPFVNQSGQSPMPTIDPYQQQPASVTSPMESTNSVGGSTDGQQEDALKATSEVAKPKFCSNCGNPVDGNFCSNCGTKIG